MATLTKTDTWTYERMVAELPEGSLFELSHGILLPMSPSPTGIHQGIVGNIYMLLRVFLTRTKLGKAFMSPLDVVLAKDEVVEPDVFVILGDPNLQVHGHVRQVPDLVVEILSPRSARRDQVEKRGIYARFGVKEYWLVDPASHYIEINKLVDGLYQEHAIASDSEAEELPTEINSALLPGLVVRCVEVFA